MVRPLRQRLVRASHLWIGVGVVGPGLGLLGCTSELENLPWDSTESTVTAPESTESSMPSESGGSSSTASTDSSIQSVSQSEGSTAQTSETPDPCNNSELDNGETAVDCGGQSCLPCGIGLPCMVSTDCESGVCADICLAAGCDNGETDSSETDQDCGGDCKACPDNARCLYASDCESGVCEAEICQAPTCEDEVANGDEPDVDCGAEGCELCPNGATCVDDEQCELGACKDGICADPLCTDSRKNGDETDVDCGGSCPPCQADQICLGPTDCDSRICMQTSSTTKRCTEAKCEDGELNGAETDKDCGGGMGCSPCGDGDICKVASDCVNSVCDAATLTCLAPECNDEVRNGSEFGIDCGGGCPGCPDGTPCGDDSDCSSGSCVELVCVAPTCNDGRKNQDESDTDCGGVCPGCGFGSDCGSAGDCLSSDCDQTCQKGLMGAECGVPGDCLSDACVSNQCVPGYRGASCVTGADCQSGYCKSDGTCGSGGLGASCAQAADCASTICTGDTCQASRLTVKSDGGATTTEIHEYLTVRGSAMDPSRAWKDIAFLYFFSLISPESSPPSPEFRSRYYSGPDFGSADNNRFLMLSPGGTDWVMVWRALSSNAANVPTGSDTNIQLQAVGVGYPSFTFSNDYSYRNGMGDNAKIVVCQRVDGRWVHTQGTMPTIFEDPCALVVDTCADTTARCELLERL